MRFQELMRTIGAGSSVAARVPGAVLLSILLAGAQPALTGFELPPPPVSIAAAEPLDDGVLVFETVAPISASPTTSA